jgi:hypothetical protein
MISDSELAHALFPKPKRVLSDAMGGAEPVTTTVATAVSDSESGRVRVDFGGATESADDEQAVEIPCSSAIRGGDTVLVTLDGTTPVDAVVMGAGDGIRREIAATAEGIAATVEKKVDASDSITAIGSVMEQTADGLDIFSTVNGARQAGTVHIDSDSVDVRKNDTNYVSVTADGFTTVLDGQTASRVLKDKFELWSSQAGETAVTIGTNDIGSGYIDAHELTENLQHGSNTWSTPSGTVLWSGSKWPDGNETIRFSAPISSCQTGVLFVWSWTNEEESLANKGQFCTFFFPKWIISEFGAMSFNCSNISPWTVNGAMAKYLYVRDTYLTGHAVNDSNKTDRSGVYITNDYWVLVAVIAV